jgi:hypothetical protein
MTKVTTFEFSVRTHTDISYYELVSSQIAGGELQVPSTRQVMLLPLICPCVPTLLLPMAASRRLDLALPRCLK